MKWVAGAGASVSVQQLDWASGTAALAPPYSLVLAADVVYDAAAPALLAKVLHDVVADGGRVLLTDNTDRPYARDASRHTDAPKHHRIPSDFAKVHHLIRFAIKVRVRAS